MEDNPRFRILWHSGSYRGDSWQGRDRGSEMKRIIDYLDYHRHKATVAIFAMVWVLGAVSLIPSEPKPETRIERIEKRVDAEVILTLLEQEIQNERDKLHRERIADKPQSNRSPDGKP